VFFLLNVIASVDIAVMSSAIMRTDVFSGTMKKLAVMVPGLVIVAVVVLDMLFATVMPAVVLQDTKM